MKSMQTIGTGLICIALTGAMVTPLGCGGDFLGLEDYQRDLLVGGLAVGLLLDRQADGDGEGQACCVYGGWC